jgi:RNA polymerase sigma-32 factor
MSTSYYQGLISKYPLLSNEENVKLVFYYQNCQSEELKKKIKEKIVNHNIRLVIHLSAKIKCPRASSSDLIQEGVIGLMNAVDKFDAEQEMKFASYAALWIRAYMLRFTIKNYFFGKFLTSDIQKKMFWKLKSKRNALGNLAYSEVLEKLAEEFKTSVEEVDYIISLLDGESTLTNDEGSQIDVSSGGNDPEVLFASKEALERADMLMEYIKEYNPSYAKIIEMRWLQDCPKTLEEIAKELGVTKQRVSQIELKIKKDFGNVFKTLVT